MNGDYCNLVKSRQPMTYSTKIQLICSSTERNPIVINTKNKCTLEFLWETSHVCDKIMLEFNECKHEAYVIGYNKNFENSKTINMKNILNTTEFFDESTQILFYLNFCNASVSLNNKLTISLMNFQYDFNKNQLNAYFKNITNIGFSSVNITIACSRKIEDLSMPKVKITNDEVKLSMYSKELCCMGYTYINEELCRNVPLTNILTSTISSINTEENKLSTNFQKYDYDPSETHLEESVLQDENNAISDHQFYKTTTAVLVDHYADKPSAKKDKSGQSSSSFYIGVMIIVLLLMSLIWFYRWKLLKEIRKILYILLLARRRDRYSRNIMELN